MRTSSGLFEALAAIDILNVNVDIAIKVMFEKCVDA
jgi:hypothetical protein